MQAADVIAYSRYERRVRQIQDCYRELLDLLSDANQKAKIFVHSYDYVRPSDEPVELFGIIKVAGPWLLPYFTARKVPPQLHLEVVKLLIDGFVAAVDAVAAEPRGVGRLFRAETRNLVGAEWKDEIHPNRNGAKKIAGAFEKALRKEKVIK